MLRARAPPLRAPPTKRSRILDDILHLSPLQSKGEFEDAGSEDSNRPSAEAPPPAPKKVMPLKVALACLDLEFSTGVESDDEGGKEEVQIKIDRPARLWRAKFLLLARMLRRRPRGTKPPLVPRPEEAMAKTRVALRIAAATLFVMLIRRLLPSS